jgi:hypothetical protein
LRRSTAQRFGVVLGISFKRTFTAATRRNPARPETCANAVYHQEAFVPQHPFIDRAALDGMDLQLNIYGIRV